MSSDLAAVIPADPEMRLQDLEISLRTTLSLWCPFEKWEPRISSPTLDESVQTSDRIYTWLPSLGFDSYVQAIVYENDEDDATEVYMNRIPLHGRSFEVLSGTGFVRGKAGRGAFAVLAIIASVARLGHGLIVDSSQTWMPENFEDSLYDLKYVDDWMTSLVKKVGFSGMVETFDRYGA